MKMKMKKILGFALTLAVTASSILPFSAISVSAENGYNGLYFYDFEDYTGGRGSLPDSNWKAVIGWMNNFLPTDTDDGHGKAMLIKASGDASLVFPKAITSGKLKVTFDAKTTTDNYQMLVKFYCGSNLGSEYGKPLFINPKDKGPGWLSYYRNPTGWTRTDIRQIDTKQWHHYEFVTSDLSSTNAQMRCYVDGELLYSDMNVGAVNGILSWTFLAEKTKDPVGSSDGFIIDNLYVNTNADSDSDISRIDNSRFSADNGRISFISSEKIQGGLKNDNVTITNALTGQSVTDFYIDRADSQAFDIVFNGKVDNGRYNITFKNVIGEVSGKTLSGSFLVETEYKTTVIDGKTVYYPEVDNIKLYDGLENELSAAEINSTIVSEVRAEFNTLVSHNLDEFITVTEDGTEIPISYSVLDNTETERSTIVINLDNSLKPFRNYKLMINCGIPSVYSSEITSFLEYTTEIKCGNEKSLKCRDFGYDPDEKTARTVFAKNDDSSCSYIYAVAGYKNVTRQTEDGEKTVRLLTEVKWAPVELKANDKGKFECSLTLDGESDAEEYHTFLWKYPKLEKLMYDEDGVILN
ncbi:MAG: hypothetical protein SOX82_03595 [Eubacteriales bacterium]|nr:hypothetical protein [Eubacteriales bacterium]